MIIKKNGGEIELTLTKADTTRYAQEHCPGSRLKGLHLYFSLIDDGEIIDFAVNGKPNNIGMFDIGMAEEFDEIIDFALDNVRNF